MLRNIFATTVIIVVIFYSPNSLAQYKISLEDAINISLKNNLQVRAAELDESDQLENLKQSKYVRLPSVSLNYQATGNSGRTLDVSAYTYTNQQLILSNTTVNTQFVLYSGGQIKNQILQNKILLDANTTQIEKLRNDLILTVKY